MCPSPLGIETIACYAILFFHVLFKLFLKEENWKCAYYSNARPSCHNHGFWFVPGSFPNSPWPVSLGSVLRTPQLLELPSPPCTRVTLCTCPTRLNGQYWHWISSDPSLPSSSASCNPAVILPRQLSSWFPTTGCAESKLKHFDIHLL